eukprot:CAMPEP_0170511054 /NCGR_PEP_ID=MMETSP0208-20121228/66097_1 /TAXON_ID=197538 /ORGANISM="Strombidium inclinatum, Strain S3" /LENGTH=94 /DNA_ID=CAMNT_0010794559 /DNA_START=337 /DNA_END=621 /DNA_ORIENTATION=-
MAKLPGTSRPTPIIGKSAGTGRQQDLTKWLLFHFRGKKLTEWLESRITITEGEWNRSFFTSETMEKLPGTSRPTLELSREGRDLVFKTDLIPLA